MDVARTTHKSTIEWVASFVRFIGQLHATIFTNVTIYVEIFVHGNDSYGFLCALKSKISHYSKSRLFIEEIISHKNEITYFDWSDSFTTGSTFWCEHSVVIVYAIDFIINIHGEGNTVKTFVANATSKASWMIGLPHCL